MRKLLKRTITGLILVALTIFLTFRGGKLLSYFVFLISIIGLREFYNAVNNKNPATTSKPAPHTESPLLCFSVLISSCPIFIIVNHIANLAIKHEKKTYILYFSYICLNNSA